MRRSVVRRLRLAGALAALLAPLAACASAPRAPQRWSTALAQWSDDGRAVILVTGTDEAIELRAHDGERGERLWRAAAGGDAARAPIELAVSPDGDRAVYASGGALWLAARGAAEVRRLAGALRDAASPSLAPDGRSVAFTSGGALWVQELAASAPQRLTPEAALVPSGGDRPFLTDFRQPGRAPLPYAWSPDSRSLAYFGVAQGAAPRLWIVDLLAPQPRAVAAAAGPSGTLLRAQWRFDARGLAVESATAGEPLRRLQLCHPEKLYCRELAQAAWSAGARLRDDFRFLENGFLWSGPLGEPSLARFDTLGRLRGYLVPAEGGPWEIAALLESSGELLVRSVAERGSDDETAGGLVLVGLADGNRRAVGGASAADRLAAAENARSWVRFESRHGDVERLVLEALDGRRLAAVFVVPTP